MPLMLRCLRHCLCLLLAAALCSPAFAQNTAPPLMLAQVWRSGMPLQDYWVSEKLDGVRGYWNGHQLLSRGGHVIAAPPWFTQGWPATPLDGELWAGRGQFAHAQATTAQATPADAAWRRMQFMVFDLPAATGSFDERLPLLTQAIAAIKQPWARKVEQQKLSSEAQLQALLRKTVKAGGEGLMLHKGSAAYRSGRSDDLLKLKPYEDAEARVIGYKSGRGQWQGMTGALVVQTADGRQFALGSGLDAAQRQQPWAAGSPIATRVCTKKPACRALPASYGCAKNSIFKLHNKSGHKPCCAKEIIEFHSNLRFILKSLRLFSFKSPVFLSTVLTT